MTKILFVYPRFSRHADDHPELLDCVPMNEYLGSPSLGIACMAAVTPRDFEIEFRDDRVVPADTPTDADIVALSMFTPAARRGLELAAYFRSLNKTVVAGGIFPSLMPDEVAPLVDAVIVGEGEQAWPQLLSDFRAGALRSRYASRHPVDLSDVPIPRYDLYLRAESTRFRPDDYPVQLSRGCPLACECCALPTSMTSNMRVFELGHVIGQLETLAQAGKRACLTEDTSWLPGTRGQKHLSRLFDHYIECGDRAVISYVGISMPMILGAPRTLLDKAKRAGVDMFYLVGGFDPITKRAFTGQDERMLPRAHAAIAKCHDVGIEPYTSFLIGGDQDDEGTVDRMLEFARRSEIKKAEFAIYTPYPGTPAWRRLEAQGRILTRDWSKYNDANVVFQPAQMSPERLTGCYVDLWRSFYADRGHLASLPIAERTIQF